MFHSTFYKTKHKIKPISRISQKQLRCFGDRYATDKTFPGKENYSLNHTNRKQYIKPKLNSKQCARCGKTGHQENTCRMFPGQCIKCGKEGHRAINCLSTDISDSPCFHCGETGHIRDFCPKRQCFQCQGFGHRAYDCPERVCRICNKVGHSANKCSTLTCRICGSNSHLQARCPKEKLKKMTHCCCISMGNHLIGT